jgi:hypothetical protein
VIHRNECQECPNPEQVVSQALAKTRAEAKLGHLIDLDLPRKNQQGYGLLG